MDEIKDADLVLSIIVTCFIFFILTSFIIAFILIHQKRRTRHLQEIAHLAHLYEQTLLRSQLEIKEQTLQQVAYELHDNLGQVASLIKINLNTLLLHDTPSSRDKVEATKELIRQLITDLKSISLSLNSNRIIQTGIAQALRTEVERLNRTEQFTAIWEETGIPPTLSENTTIILFRMVQEVINNCVKHSGAKNIMIRMQSTEKIFTLVCEDDGAGFSPQQSITGSGLLNLKSRASLINATLTIWSKPGQGTSVVIELPL